MSHSASRRGDVDADSPAGALRHRVHQVDFPALDRRIECREDETLFAAARRSGLRIVGACGGHGRCGSCIVRVRQGRVHRDDDIPRRTWQRACALRPRSDLSVDVAPRSLALIVRTDVRTDMRSDGRADVRADSRPAVGGVDDDTLLPHDPAIRAVSLQVDPPTLQDLASDSERLRCALARIDPALASATLDGAAVAQLPGLLRAHGGRIDVWCAALPEGPRLSGFAAPGAPLLGLAVDLGTSNAAAFLVDLRSGRRLASLGLENPQGAWGADLISRINHAVQDAGAADGLRQAAVNVISALAHDLARSVGATAQDIAEAVVCGNTAMQHMLAGWPVAQLGRAPFVAASCDALDLPAHSLGLQLAAGTNLHLAPGIGGFVGGDHVTALLATEPLWSAPGSSLVMDIGTNTEISLISGGRIWSASCPSGPALEGGHIASGMRAAEGAIERVRIDPNGALRLQVIGGAAPVGLCGSGVLDALAAFVGAGWVDPRGRIVVTAPGVASVDGVRAITLAEETPDCPALRFTQHDVRAVQLAKSAIRTGVRLLAAEAGLDEMQIDRLVIAGAFGAYLGVDSAVAIGLLPTLPRERISQVGNAAGLGVQQMLASRERRRRAAQLARECRYVELSARTDFQKVFLQHIGFPPRRTS
jgi:uncharacterized 2Fe-2S/4Fe-4S cluster protein (DUF4445 family)